MRTTRPQHFSFLCSLVALAVALLLGTGCGVDTAVRVNISGAAPYYGSLEDVAAGSTLVVDGVVLADEGIVPLRSQYPELSAVHGHRLLTFKVEAVRKQIVGPPVNVGDVIIVAMAAVQPSGRNVVANFDEIATEVSGYSQVPLPGASLTIFASPITFGNGESGWSISGSSYGLISREVDGSHSLAPLGPLHSAAISNEELAVALGALGAGRPQTASTPYADPTGVSTPRIGPD